MIVRYYLTIIQENAFLTKVFCHKSETQFTQHALFSNTKQKRKFCQYYFMNPNKQRLTHEWFVCILTQKSHTRMANVHPTIVHTDEWLLDPRQGLAPGPHRGPKAGPWTPPVRTLRSLRSLRFIWHFKMFYNSYLAL